MQWGPGYCKTLPDNMSVQLSISWLLCSEAVGPGLLQDEELQREASNVSGAQCWSTYLSTAPMLGRMCTSATIAGHCQTSCISPVQDEVHNPRSVAGAKPVHRYLDCLTA